MRHFCTENRASCGSEYLVAMSHVMSHFYAAVKAFYAKEHAFYALHHDEVAASDVHFVGVACESAGELEHGLGLHFDRVFVVVFGALIKFRVAPGIPAKVLQ